MNVNKILNGLKLVMPEKLHLTVIHSDALASCLIIRANAGKLFDVRDAAPNSNAVRYTGKLSEKYERLHSTLRLLDAQTSCLLMTQAKRQKIMPTLKCSGSLTDNDADKTSKDFAKRLHLTLLR